MCRREGTKLFLKGAKCFTSKCPIVRRAYPPGVHGPNAGRAKITGFGKQLREKQKAKRIYGLMEKQFRNYVLEATASKGNTAELLQQLLETRFDNAVYRLGVCESRQQARQLIGHGHVKINGKKLDIPSYAVRLNDVISFDASASKEIAKRQQAIEKHERPQWLQLDLGSMTATIISQPTLKDVEHIFNISPIVEYYSR